MVAGHIGLQGKEWGMRFHHRRKAGTGVIRSRSSPTSAILSIAVLAGWHTTLLPANSLYFDVNGATSGSGVISGVNTYTWDGFTPRWSSDPNGVSPSVQAWDSTASAIFAAGADATGTYVVTIRGTQSTAGIAIEEGVLTLTGGTLSLSGGSIDVQPASALTISSVIAGTTFTKTGSGTFVMSNAANTFTDGFAVTGGTLEYAGENVTSGTAPSRTGATPATPVSDYVRLDAGILRDTSTSVADKLLNQNKGIYLNAGGGTIDIPDPTQTNFHNYHGTISGPGGLTKSGVGVLSLDSGACSYAGATAISQGVLRLAGNDALPTTTSLSINAGATLDMASFNQSVAILTGAGKITNAGRITTTPVSNTTWSGVISGKGGLTAGGPAFTTIAAAQSYTGATIIAGDSANPFGIRLMITNALPASTIVQFSSGNGAALPTLDLNGFNQTVAGLSNLTPGVGNPAVTNTSSTPATFTINNMAVATVGVQITGNLSLTQSAAGTTTLAGSNSYSGMTTVNAGILAISQSANLGNEGAANGITLNGGTLRTIAPITTSRNISFGPGNETIDTGESDSTFGRLSGTGSLTKLGTGMLTVPCISLSNLVISGGTVRVLAGSPTIRLSGLDANAGRLDVNDNRVVFTGMTSGTLAGFLAAGRTGTSSGDWMGGSGIISTDAASDPGKTTAIAYAAAATLGITAWGDATGLTGTELVTKYTYYGDLNLDGQINADDYAQMDRSINHGGLAGSAIWTDGDVNYDRVVDAADYLLIDRAFALHGGTFSPAMLAERESRFGTDYVTYLVASVPEPGNACMLLTTMLCSIGIRRR